MNNKNTIIYLYPILEIYHRVGYENKSINDEMQYIRNQGIEDIIFLQQPLSLNKISKDYLVNNVLPIFYIFENIINSKYKEYDYGLKDYTLECTGKLFSQSFSNLSYDLTDKDNLNLSQNILNIISSLFNSFKDFESSHWNILANIVYISHILYTHNDDIKELNITFSSYEYKDIAFVLQKLNSSNYLFNVIPHLNDPYTINPNRFGIIFRKYLALEYNRVCDAIDIYDKIAKLMK